MCLLLKNTRMLLSPGSAADRAQSVPQTFYGLKRRMEGDNTEGLEE